MFDWTVTDILTTSQFRAEMEIDADSVKNNKPPEDGGDSVPMDSQESSSIQVFSLVFFCLVSEKMEATITKLIFFSHYKISDLHISISPFIVLNCGLPYIFTRLIRSSLKTFGK